MPKLNLVDGVTMIDRIRNRIKTMFGGAGFTCADFSDLAGKNTSSYMLKLVSHDEIHFVAVGAKGSNGKRMRTYKATNKLRVAAVVAIEDIAHPTQPEIPDWAEFYPKVWESITRKLARIECPTKRAY